MIVIKAQLIAEIPLITEGFDIEGCYSILKVFKGYNGHVYCQYFHSDWHYCYLFDFPKDNCQYDCLKCPNTSHFIQVDGQVLPARCITW